MELKVNYSIPVTLFNYRESDNTLYSSAKLKIFYVGQTADKRLFTKEFSDQLIKTLPYVPVVGYYNEEKEDFEGHHEEVQYIYGVVPEDTVIEYIEEDNRSYAVCDVILFTGRKDKTGEIASKIVGKQHSLELNPDDTTYKINRDGKGKIINIEFTSGSLLGLSVLGDNEKPAFAGSEFFNEDSTLMKALSKVEDEIRMFAKQIRQRGENMDINIFEPALSFLKRTYSEKIDIIYNKLVEQYEAFYIEQMFDDNIIIATWNAEKNEVEYVRIPYVNTEEGDIEFGDSTIVFPRFLTKEEVNNWEANVETNASNVDTEEVSENTSELSEETSSEESDSFEKVAKDNEMEEKDDEDEEEDYEKDEEKEEEEEEDMKKDDDDDEEKDKYLEKGTENQDESTDFSAENNNEDDANNEEEAEENQDSEDTPESFSASLNNSEREELEAFRREKKLGLIATFGEDLSKEFLAQLTDEVDKHAYDELEVILSKEFTRVIKENNNSKTSKTNVFIYPGKGSTKTDQDRLKDLVNRLK